MAHLVSDLVTSHGVAFTDYDCRDLIRLILFVGICFILMNAFGIKMWSDLSRPYLRHRFIPAAGPWMVLLLLVAIIAFIGGLFALIRLKDIVETMKDGMKYAMEEYSSNMKAKVFVDTVQLRLGCCGGQCFQDWYKLPWKRDRYVPEKDLEEKGEYNSETGEFLQESVPWSCCNPNIQRPCHHNQVWSKESKENFKYEVCVNEYGCSRKLMTLMDITMFLAGLFMRLGALLQFIIIIISRVTYTGIINGLDDFTIPSIGYLFNKGGPRGIRHTRPCSRKMIKKLIAGNDNDDQEQIPLTVSVEPPKDESIPISLSPMTPSSIGSSSSRKTKIKERRLGGGADENLYASTNSRSAASDSLRRSVIGRLSSRHSSSRRSSYDTRHRRINNNEEQLLTPLFVSSSSNDKSPGRTTARRRVNMGPQSTADGLRGSLTDAITSWLPLSNMRLRLHPGHQGTCRRMPDCDRKKAPLIRERTCSPATSNPPTSLRPFQCVNKKM